MFDCCTKVLRNYSLEIENGIDAETRVGAHQFADYNRSLWLEWIAPPPQGLCLFIDTNRINNVMEASHTAFNDLIGAAHPGSYFMGKHFQEKCRPKQNNQANLEIFLGRRDPSSCCGSAA
jgi:hypothetical protein